MAIYHLRVKNDTKPSGKKVSAKRHAEYILREEGSAHADYINREGAQSNKDDCVFKGNQLPKWAKGSPQKFFSVNRRYKEIELSLPNESSTNLSLSICRIIIMPMRSTRKQESCRENAIPTFISCDVEKMSERPAYKYFRRAARPLKGKRIASFERRREHGAPKAPKWHDKKYLCEMRADFARIQNEVLAKSSVIGSSAKRSGRTWR